MRHEPFIYEYIKIRVLCAKKDKEVSYEKIITIQQKEIDAITGLFSIGASAIFSW